VVANSNIRAAQIDSLSATGALPLTDTMTTATTTTTTKIIESLTDSAKISSSTFTNDSVTDENFLANMDSIIAASVAIYDTIFDTISIAESDLNNVIIKMYLLKKPKPSLEEIDLIVEEVPEDSVPEVVYFENITDVKLGDKIILKNIFYDFDKSTLRPESIEELEKLLDFLNKRPTLRIEISGHTDNKGSARYNKKLSDERAKSVVTYLVNKGIDINRLEAKGYGFDEPIATNDTDEGRQMNRRTEFMVIGL